MEIAQLLAVPAEQALLVAASVGLAALIRAFTGFGFAMLVVPAFSFFLTPGDAVVLSAVLALLLGLLSCPQRGIGASLGSALLSLLVGFVPGCAGQAHGRR